MYRIFYVALAAFILFYSVTTPSLAGKTVGIADKIPHQFEIPSQYGNVADFNALRGRNGLVVFFVRSADWCPFCKKQMQDFAKNYYKFKDAGYDVVSVSYDSVTTLKKFGDEKSIPYKMLSDERSKVIAAFGILNNKYTAGSRFFGIPHPTIYVIDAQGVITHVFSEDGYRSRPPIAGILRALE